MDFFGGILDNIRSVGDDVNGFFDTAIGQAVGRGLVGGQRNNNQERKGISLEEGFARGTDRSFQPSGEGRSLESVDFSSYESEWLQRLRKFSTLNTGTEAKLGK